MVREQLCWRTGIRSISNHTWHIPVPPAQVAPKITQWTTRPVNGILLLSTSSNWVLHRTAQNCIEHCMTIRCTWPDRYTHPCTHHMITELLTTLLYICIAPWSSYNNNDSYTFSGGCLSWSWNQSWPSTNTAGQHAAHGGKHYWAARGVPQKAVLHLAVPAVPAMQPCQQSSRASCAASCCVPAVAAQPPTQFWSLSLGLRLSQSRNRNTSLERAMQQPYLIWNSSHTCIYTYIYMFI